MKPQEPTPDRRFRPTDTVSGTYISNSSRITKPTTNNRKAYPKSPR